MDGSIKFNVSATTAQFDADMARVSNSATTAAAKIRGAFSGLGGLLVGGAAIGGLRSMMNEFDRVGDLASRFNTSAESIQRVAGAAKLAGTDIEAVATALTKAGIAATNAGSDGGKMAEMFARAGINAQQFANASIDQKLLMVAEAFRAAAGDADKTNAIIQILGARGGANLLPLINNVEELRKQMAGIPVASDQAVAAIQKANDQIDQMTIQLKAWGASVFDFFYQGFALTAQRIGALSAGAGFSTIQDLQEQQKREEAKLRLMRENKLLLGEDGKPVEAQTFTPNTEAGRQQAKQAEENAKRIEAELAVMREEAQKAEEAARSANSALKTFEDDYGNSLGKSNEQLKERNRLLKESQQLIPNPESLKQIGEANRNTLDTFSNELNKVHEIANLAERKRQEDLLHEQYAAAMRQIEAARSEIMKPSNLVPADAMLREAARPEAERITAARGEDARQDKNKPTDPATETTLQKVANFLEQLNTKLPQPVLA